MPKSFLFASGYLGRSRTLDHAIKHSQELSEEELTALEEVLRALLARTSSTLDHLRAVLVQRGGVQLGVRGRRGRDHEGRPNWILFGLVEGNVDSRAAWSSRTIVEEDASEPLPVPPPAGEGDPEHVRFFERARNEGRIFRYDERAPRDGRPEKPWIAGLLALALITAMVAPWPEPATPAGAASSDASDASAEAPSEPRARIAWRLRAERARLREELAFLDAEDIWRFGRAGEPEVVAPDAAGLQRMIRTLRSTVESGAAWTDPGWQPASEWPRDGKGRPIEPLLVLLGPRTLDASELRRVASWLALFQDLYSLAEAAG